MLLRPRSIAFSVVLLLMIVILSLPRNLAGSLKMTMQDWFLPLFGLRNSGQTVVRAAANAVTPREALLKRIAQLEQTNQVLHLQSFQFEEIQRENNRLRDQLGVLRQYPWKLKLAHVTGRDPANWWKSIHIDLGWRDGLRPNLTVLVPGALVGRVGEVGYNRAQVFLVGDPSCRVSVTILETRESTGIIIPPSGEDFADSMVGLAFLSRNSEIKPGQKVVTSGQGGVFPKGIPVGLVVDSRAVENGLYQEARVKLAVDSKQLEEVWVIMP
jgi:rod shape-determining protein MreC